MNLTLKIWRQKNHSDKGGFKEYKVLIFPRTCLFWKCWMC
jgi:hypothetical protein